MVVGFLVLNMVVGVVVNNYQLCQAKQEDADRRLKSSAKAKNDLQIVDKTRYGKIFVNPFRTSCHIINTL